MSARTFDVISCSRPIQCGGGGSIGNVPGSPEADLI